SPRSTPRRGRSGSAAPAAACLLLYRLLLFRLLLLPANAERAEEALRQTEALFDGIEHFLGVDLAGDHFLHVELQIATGRLLNRLVGGLGECLVRLLLEGLDETPADLIQLLIGGLRILEDPLDVRIDLRLCPGPAHDHGDAKSFQFAGLA